MLGVGLCLVLDRRRTMLPIPLFVIHLVDKKPATCMVKLAWIANNYKKMGCSKGTQFVGGFGGIGGILRWKVDFAELNSYENAAELDNDGDDDDDDESGDEYDDYGFDDGDFGF